MRPLGGAIGIAVVNTALQDNSRIAFARLGETLGQSPRAFNDAVAGMTQRVAAGTPDPAQALLEAHGIIARYISQQAITIAFDDVFRLMCWTFAAALLMVPFARSGSSGAARSPKDSR